jgi:hypothetical protein
MAISRRWKNPQWEFKRKRLPLKTVQMIRVEDDIQVANMVAQHGIGYRPGKPPIRYEAVQSCLKKVAYLAGDSSIHMPRIGCGLAGGKWDKIEPIIVDELVANGIDVYVYDLR